MDFSKKISGKFECDIQNIAKLFIEYFDKRLNEKINDYVLNWIEYVIRLIPPKKREVHFSKDFWERAPKECCEQIRSLADKFKSGQDVNPYLSKTVQNALQGKRTDMLWTDWEICHFHLSENIPNGSYFSKRSDYLLFAIIGDYFVCFLDARPHPKGAEFADPELYKYICESWPELVNNLEGISPDKDWSKEEIHKFRQRGLNVCYSYNGQVKALGGLTTVSGKSVRSVFLKDRMTFELGELSKRLADYIEKEFINFSESDYLLKLETDGIRLVCSSSNESAVLDERNYPTVNYIFNQRWLVEKMFKR
jgi:hypothetical protein